jgi:uncharacterized protein (DUF1501 family)
MTKLSRRQMFKAIGAFGVSAALQRVVSPAQLLAQASSAQSGYRALVCIALDGGCDSNNVVIPLDPTQYANYAAARPDLAIAQSTLIPFKASSGHSYGINPALPNIASLIGSGKCAVVANTGPLSRPLTKDAFNAGLNVPTNLMNHELQRIQWGTAYTNTSAVASTEPGWGGRMADALASFSSGQYPIVTALAGGAEIAFCIGRTSTPALISPGDTGFPDQALATISVLTNTPAGTQMLSAATNGLKAALQQDAALRNALASAQPLETVFPSTSLGIQLAEVAQIISSRGVLGLQRQIFLVEHVGFDTHQAQQGTFGTTISQLDAAVSAFQSALAELGVSDQVITFTTSDFNRSLAENSAGGTDHAWGGHQLVFGNAVKAADVYGAFPDLTVNGPDDYLGTGCWIPTTSVDQYGATLASWMGVPDTALSNIFPNLANFTTKNLGFV